VQQLLMNNADLGVVDHRQLTPKQLSNNNRIHSLINKYEMRVAGASYETLQTDEQGNYSALQTSASVVTLDPQ
jgi:hypothetical protein